MEKIEIVIMGINHGKMYALSVKILSAKMLRIRKRRKCSSEAYAEFLTAA